MSVCAEGPGMAVFVEVMVVSLPRPVNILILGSSLLIRNLDNFSSTFSCSQKVKASLKQYLNQLPFPCLTKA